MINKKKPPLLLLIVMILIMQLNMSECLMSRRQRGNRGLYRDIDRIRGSDRTLSSAISNPRTLSITSPESPTSSCPTSCTCRHRTVRCSGRTGMQFDRMPKQVQHMYLSGSKILTLKPGNLASVQYLTSLSLANTGLKEILPGAFEETKILQRLDLSYNQLSFLDYDLLTSLTSLRVLKANNNHLSCISPSLQHLKNLEILNLHSNLLTSLPSDVLDFMPRLRQLRLDGNRMECSCGVKWLTTFLRRNPDLGVGTFCHQPEELAGKSISTLLSYQIPCSNPSVSRQEECKIVSKCPEKCKCSHGIVDCRNLGLIKIPEDIPFEAVELRLERNMITEIGPHAFKTAPALKRIDLSRNKLAKISPESFTFNKLLTTLILYDNQLSSVPTTALRGLSNLHMILLNKNNISCLQQDIFEDQPKLVLLSLYDNNLKSLPRNFFSKLTHIKTLHLGNNPWQCDCHLYWLSMFIRQRSVESSGAACFGPSRLKKSKLETLHAEDFVCEEVQSTTFHSETCKPIEKCPRNCLCSGTLVDCSSLHLTSLPSPSSLPPSTLTLLLGKNSINRSKMAGMCSNQEQLRRISLEHNAIKDVRQGDFEGCSEVEELDLSHNNIATIEQHSLSGLVKLKKLNILGNFLVCIDKQAFGNHKHLQVVKMDLKFLECSCENRWITERISRNTIQAVNFYCNSKTPLCLGNKILPTCSQEQNCPEKCICQGDIVSCSNQGLNDIPQDIPALTRELYLDNNNIKHVNSRFRKSLVRLELLDLTNNKIVYLEEESFPSLPKLTSLILNNNKIQCIQGGAFKRLPNLHKINLKSNNLAGLDKSVFSNLAVISDLELGDNPLHCDCRITWLSSMIKKQKDVDINQAQCSSPPHLISRSLLHVPNYNLVCTGDPSDPIQSRCDPCFSQPCLHGGMCISDMKLISTSSSYMALPRSGDGQEQFACECSSLYHGDRCEKVVDACFGSPCRNGGRCTVMNGGIFKCDCESGWEGRMCQVNSDDCLDHMCRNGATCVDSIDHYECRCPEGYRGAFCQEKIPPCQASEDMCLHRGSCVEDRSRRGYHCNCQPGYEGDNCSEVGKTCQTEEQLCQHGGQCVQGETGYSCLCPQQYSGQFCQLEPQVSLLYQKTSPCAQHDCKHGVCLAKEGADNGYTCQCRQGYTGKKCEYLTTVQLVGENPFIELDQLFTQRPLNLTVVLKTKERSGVIMYHGDRDHLAVELFHGRVRVSLNVGNSPASTMFSYAVLNDDKPHAVELLLEGKNLTMRVDGGLSRSLINHGPREKLSVSRSTFLGGLPRLAGESAIGQWHLRNATSLKGCIKSFYIDEKLIDFLQASHQKPGVLAGCFRRYLDGTRNAADQSDGTNLIREKKKYNKNKRKKGCRENKCRSPGTRKCSPKGRSDYKCQCRRGYAGRYCEQAPTCRKKKSRSYIEENGCRSRKLLTQKLCKGDCHGGSCCKPKKVKKRRIGMICQDGTRYVKSVNIVKKCSCAKEQTCKSERKY